MCDMKVTNQQTNESKLYGDAHIPFSSLVARNVALDVSYTCNKQQHMSPHQQQQCASGDGEPLPRFVALPDRMIGMLQVFVEIAIETAINKGE